MILSRVCIPILLYLGMKTVIMVRFKENEEIKLYSNVNSFVKNQQFKEYNAKTIRNNMSLNKGVYEDKYVLLKRIAVIE